MSTIDGVGRREFLKGIAAMAATAHLGAGMVRAQDEAPPFRFGLIGCGGQGRVALMGNAKRIPGAQIVACCDIRPANLQQALEQAGEGAKGFEDYHEMLGSVEMDGVIVATPLTTHKDIVVAAFEAGFPVFCEKCMAYSVEDCKEMLRAQMKAGEILQIGHHLRYHPLYHHAKAAFVDKGVLGDIMAVYAQWDRNGPWRRQVPDAEAAMDFTKWGFASAEELVNWRLYKHLSGGLMTELGSHQIDVAMWMLGQEPNAVTAVGGIDFYKDGRTVPDNVRVIYEFPSGTKFYYQSLTTNAFGMFGNECHEMFCGTKGTLVLSHLAPDPASSKGWFFLEPGVQTELWMDAAHKETVGPKDAIILDVTVTEGTPIAGQPYGTLMDQSGKLKKYTYQLELEEFITSVRESKVPSCDGRIGMRSAAHAMMANQAIEQQARIPFDEAMFQL